MPGERRRVSRIAARPCGSPANRPFSGPDPAGLGPAPHGEQPPVKTIPIFRCLTVLVAAGLPGTLAAQSLAVQTNPPTTQELSRVSPSGNYLAGRAANVERDAVAAAAYYKAALKADPKNAELLELAFYADLAGGEIDEAVKLAERLVQIDRNNRNARLVLGVHAIKLRQYQTARTHLSQAARDPITTLTSTLLLAWS